jgi:hypothetical protein
MQRLLQRQRLKALACSAGLLIAAATLAFGDAGRPRTVLDLQPFKVTQSISIQSTLAGDATLTLINLNPTIGVWYVLTVTPKRGVERAYHLENPRPQSQTLVLDQHYASGLIVVGRSERFECDLLTSAAPLPIDKAAASGTVFQPLCGSRVYLRNRASGRHTRLETAADLLREHVWGGESLIDLGHQIFGDRNLETGTVSSGTSQPVRSGPLPALVDPTAAERTLVSENLGIAVVGGGTGLRPGAWYAATGYPGIYVSILQPELVAAPILRGREASVSALDAVESAALCYLVAFDLSRFDLGYGGGTEHPAVGWSAHMRSDQRDANLPGPDGIATTAPLIQTGLIGPDDRSRTIATFTGGFKREHGAFVYGALALRNHGSHYGFVENGTTLSTLQPGLATILVMTDGRVDLKTWQEQDAARLREVRHARQNGVPIVEYDEASQATIPGALVNQWGPGNWSGSQDLKLRTIRAAAAIQTNGQERYFIYAVFSAATPSAMARVFQAYRCRYGMLLDMNALEHTYFALHRREANGLKLEYLIKGMSVVDRASAGGVVPRFVECPDNRDFFYFMQREERRHP